MKESFTLRSFGDNHSIYNGEWEFEPSFNDIIHRGEWKESLRKQRSDFNLHSEYIDGEKWMVSVKN